MANIEINVDNKKYTKSSDNKKLIKTNTLKEKASADVEEVDLDSETYNVESTKTETITTDNTSENYNMTNSEIKSIVEQMKKTKKEYVKYYNEVESKYTDNSNKDWYENGILTANPTTTLPYTPEEYKEFLMSHNHISSDEELKNNKDLTSKITSYNKEYEEQFEKIVGISYSEYKELKDSYKSDLVILDNTISSLSSLAKEQKYNEVLDTDSFKSYMSTKSKMTFSDLEKNYNEYNSKSADITESAEASINMYDTYNPMYIIEYAEKLAEKEKFDITDVLEKQVQSYQYDLSDFYEYYKVMTDDEKNLYSYYFETKGREAAEKYFNDMKDSWNKKIAYNRFQEDVSDLDLTDEGAVKESIANILNVNVDGIGDGINQFMSGIANSITNNKEITIEEYKTMYYLSYLEQNSKILSTSYKVGTATGNMLPSVTAGVLTAIIAPEIAPSISQGLIGVSSYGNSKHNALIQGYSLPTSMLYGVMSGSSEVLFEKFGGIIGIADNPGSNAIIRALKEGVEEGAQSYIQAGIDAVVLGKEINLDDMNDDAKESFIVGMLVAYTTNIYSKGLSDSINFIQNGEKISISKEEILNLLDSKINDESLNAVDKNVLFINDMFDSILNKFKFKNDSNVSSNSTLDSIVSDLYKNGYNAWVRIGEYYNSGNIEYIPENLRSTIKEIPKSEIYNFLTSAEANTKYGTNYASPLDSVISTINNEGYNGWSRLYKYYESGDISYLPESVRSTVENISKDEIYNFLVSPGNNFKYGTDYMTNIAQIVSKLNKEGYDGWNVISQYIKSGNINCIPKSVRSKIMDIPKTKISSFLSSQSAYYNYSKSAIKERIVNTFYNFYLNNMNKSPKEIRKSTDKIVENLKNSGYSVREISSMLEKANTKAINDSGIFETYISDLGLTIKMQDNMNINISNELSELRSLPKEIQNLASGKTFTYLKTPNPTDYSAADYYGIEDFSSSAATYGDGNITFYNGTSAAKGTLTHEIGHTFDKVYSGKSNSQISTSKMWKKAMKADEKLTNDVAVTDYPRSVKNEERRASEDFAESFKLYYTNPNELKKYKNRYEILEKILPKNYVY